MANLRKWSTTATGNASVAGGANTINFAEGQTPGSVNNSAREMMAQVRGIYTPSEWGWVENSATASVASQTTFKLAGNQTSDWVAPRRWRLKSGSTTRYGTVVSSSFTSETTITVTVDSGSLSASHSLAALSPIDNVSNQLPVIRTDASGNVGIGTTPVLTLDVAGSMIHAATQYIGSNLYFSSGWKYKANGYGAYLQLADGSGVMTIGNAPNNVSGAGAAATPVSRLTMDASGNILNISSGGLGYGSGSGGSVTQVTSRLTAVTLNKTNGAITLFNAAGSASVTFFTVNNSTVAATDTIILSVKSATNTYNAFVTAVAAGSFNLGFISVSGTAADSPVINFAVIKAVTA